MKKIEVQKYRHPSSPAKREVAKSQLTEINRQMAENKAATVATQEWLKPLLKAARFVVDVNGDPPSIEQLQVAIEQAERQRALGEEHRELRIERDRLASESRYHQYHAGHVSGVGGIGFLHVVAEGDTKREALEKAKASR